MKKKIFITLALTIITVCLFAIGASAADKGTYYVVQDDTSELAEALRGEGKNVVSAWDLYSDAENCIFNSMVDGDSIVFNLAQNLKTTASSATNKADIAPAIRIDKAITVTVNFLGSSWYQTTSQGYDGFILYNEGATLNLIGSKAKLEDGTVRTLGKSYSSDEFSDEIDLYSNFVAVYAAGGKLYCENLSISCAEETIYQKDSYLKGVFSAELVDSSILARGNYYTIGIAGKAGSKNNLKINGGVYGSICIHNALEDSYIKNATLLSTKDSNSLYIDSWNGRNAYTFPIENSTFEGRYFSEGDSNVIIAKNSTFDILYLKGDSSGGAYAELIDCTYNTVDFTGNKGTGTLTVIESPTCETTGTKTVYTLSNQAGVVDEAYATENPANGHTIVDATSVSYTNYAALGYYNGVCSVCGVEGAEKVASAPALVLSLGYSYNESDEKISMTQGYKINTEMLAFVSSDISYGLVACVNTSNEAIKAKEMSSSVTVSLDANYNSFTIKMTSIPMASADVNIIFCAYIVENEKTYYVDNTQTYEALVGQSANSVKAILENK